MRVRRGLLRLPRRSLLAALFFFSLSSSLLYFVYVAPGIGRRGIRGPGVGGTALISAGGGLREPTAPPRGTPAFGGHPAGRRLGAWRLEDYGDSGPILGRPPPLPATRRALGGPGPSRPLNPDGLRSLHPTLSLPPTLCPPSVSYPRANPTVPSARAHTDTHTHPRRAGTPPVLALASPEPPLPAARLGNSRPGVSSSPGSRHSADPEPPSRPQPARPSPRSPGAGVSGVPPSRFPSILLLSSRRRLYRFLLAPPPCPFFPPLSLVTSS